MENQDNVAAEMDEVPKGSPTKVSITKSIKQHFFDFLMLFLAITLGFFADNFRDAYGENQKAQQLAADLRTDLAADTIMLNRLITERAIKINKLDSLFTGLQDGRLLHNDSMLYLYSAYVTERPFFERNNGTWQQMTSAGYLSFFSKNASRQLSIYDIQGKLNEVKENNERMVISQKIYPFLQQIFYTEHFTHIRNGNMPDGAPPLQNWNTANQWLYHNYVSEMKEICTTLKADLQELKQRADTVLVILEKEYE